MTGQEFRALILPLQDAMYRVAFLLLRQEDDAADIVQDTILRIWQRHDEISESQNHKAYCLTAVRNGALSLIRSREENVEIPESIPAPDNVQDRLESKESLSLVKKAIESLPANQREVIRLSSYMGCSNDEIAGITGLTPVNVRALLSRGRRRIRELMMNK